MTKPFPPDPDNGEKQTGSDAPPQGETGHNPAEGTEKFKHIMENGVNKAEGMAWLYQIRPFGACAEHVILTDAEKATLEKLNGALMDAIIAGERPSREISDKNTHPYKKNGHSR